MSYILQALKESEAKREANVAPDTEIRAPASERVAPPAAKRRFPLVWLLGGILIALAVVLALPIEPPTEATAESKPAGIGETPPEVIGSEPTSGSDSDKSALVGVKLVLNPPVEERRPLGAQTGSVPQSNVETQAEPSVAAIMRQPEVDTAPVESPEAPDPYAQIPYLRQLPAELQRSLPELRFSVHIYSESRAGRLVKLGDRMMREGQRLTPELSIEAIVPRGVVMRYREQLFKVPTR